MSSSQNPWPAPEPNWPPPLPAPVSTGPEENPAWTGWDVAQIVLLTIISIFILALLITVAAQRLFYPQLPISEVATFPLVAVAAQMLAYVWILGFMVSVVRRHTAQPFFVEVRWRWPRKWSAYLLAGLLLSLGLQLLAHLLPIPKQLPMDRFFQTGAEAWALSIFGITLAPLFEELFFRGFLYPVLARRFGVFVSVLLTALGFSLIHAPQLGRAWGPVLVIFLVGLALTIARAVTKSVAPGFLMHVAYNGTISVALFIATDGFRHLEKLNQ